MVPARSVSYCGRVFAVCPEYAHIMRAHPFPSPIPLPFSCYSRSLRPRPTLNKVLFKVWLLNSRGSTPIHGVDVARTLPGGKFNDSLVDLALT